MSKKSAKLRTKLLNMVSYIEYELSHCDTIPRFETLEMYMLILIFCHLDMSASAHVNCELHCCDLETLDFVKYFTNFRFPRSFPLSGLCKICCNCPDFLQNYKVWTSPKFSRGTLVLIEGTLAFMYAGIKT